jgi:hypothetical protein
MVAAAAGRLYICLVFHEVVGRDLYEEHIHTPKVILARRTTAGTNDTVSE